MSAATAAAIKIEAGATVSVSSVVASAVTQPKSALLELAIDNALALNVVRLSAGHPSVANFAALTGAIALVKA